MKWYDHFFWDGPGRLIETFWKNRDLRVSTSDVIDSPYSTYFHPSFSCNAYLFEAQIGLGTKKDAQENQISPQSSLWCSKAGIQGNFRSSLLYCMHKKVETLFECIYEITFILLKRYSRLCEFGIGEEFFVIMLKKLKFSCYNIKFKCEVIIFFNPMWNNHISQSIWCRSLVSSSHHLKWLE